MYKNLFLKKIQLTTYGLDLAGVEKREVITDSEAPKSDFLLLSNDYLTLSTNSETEL